MLQKLMDILNLDTKAEDGDIGTVHDALFDDRWWVLRYLVVDTAKWLPGRRVLISPVAVESIDRDARKLRVHLARRQVEGSPGIEADKPVSRQMEEQIARYYNWPMYWGATFTQPPPPPPRPGTVAGDPPQPMPAAATAHDPEQDDPNLRSAREVKGYDIEARDGEVGHVDGYVLDPRLWAIRYVIADTRRWLPGRKLLVSPAWIGRIDWGEARLFVDLERERVESSPEYDPDQPITPDYEELLFAHYGRQLEPAGAAATRPGGR